MWENLDFSIFNAHKEMEKMKMYCTVYNDGSSYVAYENLPRKKLPNYESNNIKSSSIDESEKRIDEITDFIN